MTGSSRTLDGNTAPATIADAVALAAGDHLTLLGAIVDVAGIAIVGSSSDGAASLDISGPVQLSGGGTITLADSVPGFRNDTVARIAGASAADVLDNSDNTIAGYGEIGQGSMGFVNEAHGIVDATASTLVLSTGAGRTANRGVMRADSATLVIASTLDNRGGQILAGPSGTVQIGDDTVAGTIQGGTIATASGGGVMASRAGATLDGSQDPVAGTAVIGVSQGESLTLRGTIRNGGQIALFGSSSLGAARLSISGRVTLTGGGALTLADTDRASSAGSIIDGSSVADVLDNVDNTITSFGGTIGAGTLGFANEAGGTVNVVLGTLLINTGPSPILNAGTLNVAGGTAEITSPLVNDGRILVDGQATLVLHGAVSGSGQLDAQIGSALVLDGATLTGTGSYRDEGRTIVTVQGSSTLDGRQATIGFSDVVVTPNAGLTLMGTIVNRGTLEVGGNSDVGRAILAIAGHATLTGGGTVELVDLPGTHQDPAVASIAGASTADLLENVDNTIGGFGQIGQGKLSIINRAGGQIEATDGTLTLDTGPGGAGSIVNQGVLRAVGFGRMVITGDVADAGGTIGIGTVGCSVTLHDAAVSGGQLQGFGDGIQVDDAGASLDGSADTLSILGNVDVASGATLTLRGAIEDIGTITLQDSSAALKISGRAALSGGGTVAAAGGVIAGSSGGDVLDNVDDTISGAGEIGAGRMSFVNEADGTVNAAAGTLTLDTGAVATVNAGTIATAGGALVFQSAVTNTGQIAAQSGSVTFMQTVSGGMLQIGGGQTMTFAGGVDGGAAIWFSQGGTAVIAAGQTLQAMVGGFLDGDTLDLQGVAATGSYAGGVLTLSAGGGVIGTLTMVQAGESDRYATQDDGHGGTLVVHQTVTPSASAVHFTNVQTATKGADLPSAYTGPANYLQHQYIWSGQDSVAIKAPAPNTLLMGGTGSDALAVSGGQNVLAGGAGSNFLVGATGSDGGTDTFSFDASGRTPIWTTIVNFHQGDTATILGYHAGLSAMPFTDNDGAPGYTGLTIHAEIDGPGTGVTASLTFAGIDQATARAHFVFTSGSTADHVDYLTIAYR